MKGSAGHGALQFHFGWIFDHCLVADASARGSATMPFKSATDQPDAYYCRIEEVGLRAVRLAPFLPWVGHRRPGNKRLLDDRGALLLTAGDQMGSLINKAKGRVAATATLRGLSSLSMIEGSKEELPWVNGRLW